MAKYTQSQAKAIKKYLSNIGEVKIRTSKEDISRYKEKASSLGLSLNQFIICAIEEKIKKGSE